MRRRLDVSEVWHLKLLEHEDAKLGALLGQAGMGDMTSADSLIRWVKG